NSTPVLIRTRIEENFSGGQFPGGGGVEVAGGSARLVHCEIVGNFSDRGGGVRGENVTLEGCLLANNVGRAVYLTGDSRMANCLVYGNQGGVYADAAAVVIAGDAVISNSTIYGNSRGLNYPVGGLAVLSLAKSVRVTNSIIWGNIGAPMLVEGPAS